MSEEFRLLRLASPTFLSKEEHLISPSHKCNYCQGNGWFWGRDEYGEGVKNPCPMCQGSGVVDAVVEVAWVPGKVKSGK